MRLILGNLQDISRTCWYVTVCGRPVVEDPGKFLSSLIKLNEFPKAGVFKIILSIGTPRPTTTSIKAS